MKSLEVNLNTHREHTSLSDVSTIDALIELVVSYRELWVVAGIFSDGEEVASLSPYRHALQP